MDQNLNQKSHFFLILEDTIIVHLKESQRWMFASGYGRGDVVKLLCLQSFENETFRVIFKHCGLL